MSMLGFGPLGAYALGQAFDATEPTVTSTPSPYVPPTAVNAMDIPYLALVTRADPDFNRRKHREIEYEFSNRVFIADPYVRGAYAPD